MYDIVAALKQKGFMSVTASQEGLIFNKLLPMKLRMVINMFRASNKSYMKIS